MGDLFGEEVAGQPPLQRARVGDIIDLDGVTLDPAFGLGREAAAMVNAIKAALNPVCSSIRRDVENVRTQLMNMSLKVDLMTTRMDSLSRVDKTDKNVQDLMSRTAALEQGGVTSNSSVKEEMWEVPEVVGLVAVTRDIYTPGPFASFGKIKFISSQNMWTFLKALQGHKFQFQGNNLFHHIDSTEDETHVSKRTSAARNVVAKHLQEPSALGLNPTRNDILHAVPCDWDGVIVRFRSRDGQTTRRYEASRSTGLFEVSSQAGAAALNLRYAQHLQ
ncbi:unnamed protein product, partial [Prorocentrum cordatum]